MTAHKDLSVAVPIVGVCLGCNLVSYRQRFYAVPQSLGKLNLTALEPSKLESFASASDLVELKNLLLLGPEEYKQALQRASHNSEPRLLEEGYLGYNLIAYASRIWAVEMAAEPLDFTNAAAVEDWLAGGRLLRADTVDGARAAVDRHLLEVRVASLEGGQAKFIDHFHSFKSGEFHAQGKRRWWSTLNPPLATSSLADSLQQSQTLASEFTCAGLCFVNHDVSEYVDAIGNAVGDLSASDRKPKNILLVGDDLPLSEKIAKKVGKLHGKGVAMTQVLTQDFELARETHYDVAVIMEPNGEVLSRLLLKCVDHPATLIAPITEHHITRRGAYVITIPKSGSHMLYELLEIMGVHHDQHGYIRDMEQPQPGTWKSARYPHTHLWAPEFLTKLAGEFEGGANHPFFSSPVLFMYRNPRDILVSEGYYYTAVSKSKCNNVQFIGPVSFEVKSAFRKKKFSWAFPV